MRGKFAKHLCAQRFRWPFRREFSLSLQALFSACVLRTASANISRNWSLVFAGSRFGGCHFVIGRMWGAEGEIEAHEIEFLSAMQRTTDLIGTSLHVRNVPRADPPSDIRVGLIPGRCRVGGTQGRRTRS
jgi:hypothetical protein